MKRSFLYLSEFHVGDKFTTLSRTVTETDVVLFAGITGTTILSIRIRPTPRAFPLRAESLTAFWERESLPDFGAAWGWWTAPQSPR